MNKDNLRILVNAIASMPEDRHYFPLYQSVGRKMPVRFYTTMESFVQCENCASVFGYFVLTPEWVSAGGSVNCVGEPVYKQNVGVPAIMAYLDTTFNTARKMVCGDLLYKDILDESKVRTGSALYSEFYEKEIQNITVADVVSRLSKFLPC